MISRVTEINPQVLKQCRLQLGISIQDAQRKVKHIEEIEHGEYVPTFTQLDLLSKLYNVPRWVFICQELPNEFNYEASVPAFRQFSERDSQIFSDPTIRSITATVNKLRTLFIDLLEDMDEEVMLFSPPSIDLGESSESAARRIRTWLGIGDACFTFSEWKDKLEGRGIFIFLTSKFVSWSHIERERLRGFSIYHDTQPIIVINNTDWKKAQSFTLLHELGHLLRKESSIDDWRNITKKEEAWCDDFAGCVLIPENLVKANTAQIDFDYVKRTAKKMKVSSYSFIVRMRRLNLINQELYDKLDEELSTEYQEIRRMQDSKYAPISRNRASEIIQQYGKQFTSTLFQAYNNKEISLHKLSQLLEVKTMSTLFEIGTKL